MSLLSNAWLIGIATGVASGLLVTWLLRVLISKKKTREYKQQLVTANREIIYSIRAGIPEGNMPSREVIEAMIHATARRYEVEASELYTIGELIEELVKEVMDTSFLSSQKKEEYCTSLLELTVERGVKLDAASVLVARKSAVRMRSMASELEKISSLLLGMTAAVASALGIRKLLDAAAKVHWTGSEHFSDWAAGAAIIALTFAVVRFFWLDIKASYRRRSKK